MSRHKWELVPGHGLAWKCANDGCSLYKQERPHERIEHQGYTDYYVIEQVMGHARKILLPKGKVAECPYRRRHD